MKKKINKINTYLLENYPTLWNTRVVWVLGIATIIHIIFYLFGLSSLTNPETLHNRNVIENFFKNGMLFFSIMVSIIILVTWLIFMFKNNAFKNFYPTKKIDIFKQFVLYFIIILCATTFYYSYLSGAKTYIINTYQNNEIAQDIALANKTAPFFSHGINNYTIANVNYPEPLNKLYCEIVTENIDYEKTNYKFLNGDYQFYDLRSKTRSLKTPYNNIDYQYNVFTEQTDSTITYYFKNEVQDISSYIKTTEPSYYNYSKLFYSSKSNRYNSYNNHNNYTHLYNTVNKNNKEKFSKKAILYNLSKANYELLERNNPDEIKATLSNFLKLSKKYKIKHNLNEDIWFSLIYQPRDFRLKHIINNEERSLYYDNLEHKVNLAPLEKLYKEIKSDYYLESNSLGIVFENIEELKSKPLVSFEIHFFLWISFITAMLILIFRITGLKSLIFSIIASGVLMIFVALVTALFNYTISGGKGFEYFVFYFVFLIGSIIIIVALFLSTKIKKQITAIFINISLAGFAPYIFLICALITKHQDDACRLFYSDYQLLRKEKCFMLLETLNPSAWSFIFLCIGFVFLFFFSKTILNWKAMPEN